MGTRYYLIDVFGIEPELKGPYATEITRDTVAQQVRAEQDAEDALFWLDITENGTPSIGAFTANFFIGEK